MQKMSLKSDILALGFGVLLILVTFGDSWVTDEVGNLDMIFGATYWHSLLEVVLPLTSIAVFLLYGKAKGGIQLHITAILLFLTFLIALIIIDMDDIFAVVNYARTLPRIYWVVAQWFYPFYSASAFFAFGWVCEKLKRRTYNMPDRQNNDQD